MKTIAHIVSVVFHPLLMCSYGSIIFFFFLKGSLYDMITPFKTKVVISLMIFCFSFLLPLINIYILYRLRRISSITLKEQRERTFPYVLTSCFYFGLFYLFMDLSIWPEIKILIFAAGLAILLTAVINMKFRISAHTVGVGGLTGSVMIVSSLLKYDAVPVISGLILLGGLIATSRLYLNAHRPSQVYAGYFLGLFTQVIVFLAFLKFNLT